MENSLKLITEDNTNGIQSDAMENTTKVKYELTGSWLSCQSLRKILGAMYTRLACTRTQTEVNSQLYCPNTSVLQTPVMEQLRAMLKERLNAHGVKLNMTICQSKQELFKKDTPLIVVCLQSSRLGTDVSNAVKGIENGSDVAVLVLHRALRHALPSQSSSNILTAQEYKTIAKIVDMGFHSDEGIYDCDTNKRALDDLTLYIKNKSLNL